MYENGALKASDTVGKVVEPRQINSAQTNLCIGGRVPNVFGSDFAKFAMKSLAVFDETIPSKDISSVGSFYRDYDGAGKKCKCLTWGAFYLSQLARQIRQLAEGTPKFEVLVIR